MRTRATAERDGAKRDEQQCGCRPHAGADGGRTPVEAAVDRFCDRRADRREARDPTGGAGSVGHGTSLPCGGRAPVESGRALVELRWRGRTAAVMVAPRRPTMPATHVRLLGPVELGATKQRAVLAILALRANGVVSVDELVEGLWGEEPPASATKLVQHYVSQLRKLLAGGDAAIVTRGRGYELRVRPDAVDAVDFERLAGAAARGDGNGTAARRALSLWRGSPLLEVIDEPFAAMELRRLEDLWLNLSEQAIRADIEAGRYDEVIARLNGLIGRHPLRERLHALRMRALYAAGRRAEALETFRHARSILVEEIGVEPGP